MSQKEINLNLLSTGDPSTLGSYRKLCAMVGFHKAEKFFIKRIEKEGEDAEVIQDEVQVMHLIMSLEHQ